MIPAYRATDIVASKRIARPHNRSPQIQFDSHILARMMNGSHARASKGI
jgi:hypothetical protein